MTVMVLVSSGYSLGSPEMNNNTECACKQSHQNVNTGMQIQKPACFIEMWTGGQMDEWVCVCVCVWRGGYGEMDG